jgi:hypothetical protein
MFVSRRSEEEGEGIVRPKFNGVLNTKYKITIGITENSPAR